MKNILVALLFIFFSLGVSNSQHFIGKYKDEIKKIMKESLPDFKLDNSTVNTLYKYLKYVDSSNEQTMLLFLDNNDRCIFSKLVSDYSNLDEVVSKLNQKFKGVKKNEWIYMNDHVKYSVTLTEEEWFFTVVTKKY